MEELPPPPPPPLFDLQPIVRCSSAAPIHLPSKPKPSSPLSTASHPSLNIMKRKGFISEGDVALLLRRYSANTLLALLQEIASSGSAKLNWHSLVKSSNTGIKNAREYQALWRHLAYRTNIADGFEEDCQPLEDESDLEFEVEPLPGVSPEVAAEVAACVKVLATTGTSGGPPSSKSCVLDASLAIDIPNSASGWDVKGNGQVSGTSSFVHTPNTTTQGTITGSVPEMQPVRKKRKLWTPEEDQELIAAVEKCGEGNWATILKGAFKHDRTASQLSQRWALIRKRREGQAVLNQSNSVNATGSQISNGGQANTAVQSLILPATADGPHVVAPSATSSATVPATTSNNEPTSGAISSSSAVLLPTQEQNNLSTFSLPPSGKIRPSVKKPGVPGSQSVGGGRPISSGTVAMSVAASQVAPVIGIEKWQAKVSPTTSVSSPTTSVSLPIVNPGSGRYNISSGLRNSSVNPAGRGNLKTSTRPDPMVQAAAVAAGARIAPASAAASLMKAAQSGNVVHIGPGGFSTGKGGISTQAGNTVTTTIRVNNGVVGSRSSSGAVVRYMRTGSGASSSSFLMRTSQLPLKNHMAKNNTAQVTLPICSGATSVPMHTSTSQVSPSKGPPPMSSQLQAPSSQFQKGSTPDSSEISRLKSQSSSIGLEDSSANTSPSAPEVAVVPVIAPSAMDNQNFISPLMTTANSIDPLSVGELVGPVMESEGISSGSENASEVMFGVLPASSAVSTDTGGAIAVFTTTNGSESFKLNSLPTSEYSVSAVLPVSTSVDLSQIQESKKPDSPKLIPCVNEQITGEEREETMIAASLESDCVLHLESKSLSNPAVDAVNNESSNPATER